MIHLDTQVAVWLFLRKTKNLSAEARSLLRRSRRTQLSAIVVLEIEILAELGRADIESVGSVVDYLADELGVEMSKAALGDVVAQARRFAWTREPFDRLIVANAMADGARLVTADKRILANFKDAVW